MVPIIVFVAGVAVGISICKFYDFIKANQTAQSNNSHDTPIRPMPGTPSFTGQENIETSTLNISSLEPIMRKYNVNIQASNCLYLLCNKIKNVTYKNLLEAILATRSGEELIKYINNVNIETFSFPNTSAPKGRYNIPLPVIDQLLASDSISTGTTDYRKKVETLINAAYAYAVIRVKDNFSFEWRKLIEAHENGNNLEPYYNDLIKEIKLSRDLLD